MHRSQIISSSLKQLSWSPIQWGVCIYVAICTAIYRSVVLLVVEPTAKRRPLWEAAALEVITLPFVRIGEHFICPSDRLELLCDSALRTSVIWNTMNNVGE